MMLRNTAIIILLIIASMMMANTNHAQSSGQFCIRAYEDLDKNGQPDPGEPLLTHSIGANLHNSTGLIVASALLDNSPTSEQGVICFPNLPVGQYMITITSAEYSATSTDSMMAAITGEGLPTVFEYGAQRSYSVTQNTTSTNTEADDEATFTRLLVAAAGALITMMVVTMVGVMIYFVILRGSKKQSAGNMRIETSNSDEYYSRPQ
jgi:hypothetical protein